MEKANQAERDGARLLMSLKNTLEQGDAKIRTLVREINGAK